MQNLTPFADILLVQAREYLDGKKEDNFAIILAHMACEIETEFSLTRLIQPKQAASRIRPASKRVGQSQRSRRFCRQIRTPARDFVHTANCVGFATAHARYNYWQPRSVPRRCRRRR